MTKPVVDNPGVSSSDSMVRLLVPHSAGCYAVAAVVNGDWPTAWAFFDSALAFWASKTGRRSARISNTYRWAVAICNCTTCPARIAVRETELLNVLPPR